MRLPMLAVVSSLLFSAVPSAAEETLRLLPPASPWAVDYAEDSCALRRSFGAADKQVVWELRQFEPGNTFYVTVVGKGIRVSTAGKVRAVFDPGKSIDRDKDIRFVTYANGLQGFTYLTSLTRSDSNREQPASGADLRELNDAERDLREKAITGYSVTKGLAFPATLQTGELHAPMRAMRQCLDELVTHWGIDAAAQKTLTRRAKALDQQLWARRIQEYYPSKALANDESGFVLVRMIVDPAGQPSSCHIQMKAKEDTFERAACEQLMRYAKFEPALDAKGMPIASYYLTRIYYLVN